MNTSSRHQKPTLRDFLLVQAETRSRLCRDDQIFDPCKELTDLTEFERATLRTWSSDSNVDKGLNLYILLHFLSSTNDNSYYYHYVNNGSPDGTNMFGHIIGTSGYSIFIKSYHKNDIKSRLGSGKSSALTPHMDALARSLAQIDLKQEYIQHPSQTNGIVFEQPFIISNVKFDRTADTI